MMQFEKDLNSPYKQLFLAVRDYLCAHPGVEELKKERITTYSLNGSALCHLRTVAQGVDVGFLKGAQFEDKHGLLHGKTRKMRVLTLTQLHKPEIDYYLTQAIDRNALRFS